MTFGKDEERPYRVEWQSRLMDGLTLGKVKRKSRASKKKGVFESSFGCSVVSTRRSPTDGDRLECKRANISKILQAFLSLYTVDKVAMNREGDQPQGVDGSVDRAIDHLPIYARYTDPYYQYYTATTSSMKHYELLPKKKKKDESTKYSCSRRPRFTNNRFIIQPETSRQSSSKRGSCTLHFFFSSCQQDGPSSKQWRAK